MNFYTNNNDKIEYVHVHVHSSKIIVSINSENKLYDHEDYLTVLSDLKEYFKERNIESIKEYIIENLKHIGIIVIIPVESKKDDNQQLSLF